MKSDWLRMISVNKLTNRKRLASFDVMNNLLERIASQGAYLSRGFQAGKIKKLLKTPI